MHVDYIAIFVQPKGLNHLRLFGLHNYVYFTHLCVGVEKTRLPFLHFWFCQKRFGCVNVINFTSLILIRWENKQSVFIASINSGDKLITLSYRCLDPKYGNNLPCGFKMKKCIGTKHNLRPKSHPTQWRMRTNSNRSPEWLKWLKNILKSYGTALESQNISFKLRAERSERSLLVIRHTFYMKKFIKLRHRQTDHISK